MTKDELIKQMEERISKLNDDKYDAMYNQNYHEAGTCKSKVKEIQYWIGLIKNLNKDG